MVAEVKTFTFIVADVKFEVQSLDEYDAFMAANERLWTDLNPLVKELGRDNPSMQWIDGDELNTFVWARPALFDK